MNYVRFMRDCLARTDQARACAHRVRTFTATFSPVSRDGGRQWSGVVQVRPFLLFLQHASHGWESELAS